MLLRILHTIILLFLQTLRLDIYFCADRYTSHKSCYLYFDIVSYHLLDQRRFSVLLSLSFYMSKEFQNCYCRRQLYNTGFFMLLLDLYYFFV